MKMTRYSEPQILAILRQAERGVDDARAKMEEWRRDDNEVRHHSAIGNEPPISLVNCSAAAGPP